MLALLITFGLAIATSNFMAAAIRKSSWRKRLQEINTAKQKFSNAKNDDERQLTLLRMGKLITLSCLLFGSFLGLLMLPMACEVLTFQFNVLELMFHSGVFCIAMAAWFWISEKPKRT
jgi:hypothetical protein